MNIVLVPSIIHTPNTPFNYINKRSIYSSEERFTQTKETIESIKQYIPNYFIICVECSRLTQEQVEYFSENVNIFINVFENSDYKEKIYSNSKSYGEGTMTLIGIAHLLSLELNWKSFFKISGRYKLNKQFDFSKYDNNNNIIKSIDNNRNNMHTSLYKLNIYTLHKWYSYLQNSESKFKQCIGYELLFANFLFYFIHQDKRFVKTLGVEGYIAVSGDRIDA